MCAAAVAQISIVGEIVFGCMNPRFGACGSVHSLDMYRESGKGGPSKFVPEVENGAEAAQAALLVEKVYTCSNPNAPKARKRAMKR